MLDVRYIDNHLLVVVKPAGVSVQADRTGDEDLLSQAKVYVKERFAKPGRVFLGLVHRLDRPTSGIVVFARTSKSAARLSEAFRIREVEKRYLALVEGVPDQYGSLDDWLVRGESRVRVVRPGTTGAKQAEMSFQMTASNGRVSLLDIKLRTGRRHQIRAQLSARGFPIVGDKRYGASRSFQDRSLALHCSMLGFQHPVRKTGLRWTSTPPETWHGWFQNELVDAVENQSKAESDGIALNPTSGYDYHDMMGG